jgi:S-formylglutathione hydrolase
VDTYVSSFFFHSSRASHCFNHQGALTLYLKNLSSSLYLSASAFAPITNPTKCPWGEKAFKGYLAGGVDEGKQYDASELLKEVKGKEVKILVDVGTGDQFYKDKQRTSAFFLSSLLPSRPVEERSGE